MLNKKNILQDIIRNYLLIIISILCLLNNFSVYAEKGDFIASVKKNIINKNEGVVLTLKLNNISNSKEPSIEPLNNDFSIIRTERMYNIEYINGKKSSSNSWILHLIPKQNPNQKDDKYNLVIPQISISTDKGTLSSNEIKITVINPEDKSSINENNKIILEGNVNKKNVYLHEPLILTLSLVTDKQIEINELEINESNFENFIFEDLDRKFTKEIIDGIEHSVINLKYILIPIKSGKIKIEPMKLYGKLLNNNSNIARNFNFGMFQLPDMEPFTISNDPINMEVKQIPANYNHNYFLPTRSLSSTIYVKDLIDEKKLEYYVGDLIELEILLEAELGNIERINNIEKLLKPYIEDDDGKKDYNSVRIYPDLAKITKSIDKKNFFVSQKKQSINLVAYKAGNLILPELKIHWWDTKSNQEKYTILPQSKIKILEKEEGVVEKNNDDSFTDSKNDNNIKSENEKSYVNDTEKSDKNSIFGNIGIIIIAICVFIIFLLIFFFVRIAIRKKDNKYNSYSPDGYSPSKTKINKSLNSDNSYLVDCDNLSHDNLLKSEINNSTKNDSNIFKEITIADDIDNAEKLSYWIREYAFKNWKCESNMTLKNIFISNDNIVYQIINDIEKDNKNNEFYEKFLEKYNEKPNLNLIKQLFNSIEKIIYFNDKSENLIIIKDKIELLINMIEYQKKSNHD